MAAWKPGHPSHFRIEASVRWFDPVKGYGFLAPTGGQPDVFCHISVVCGAGFETLPEGATVICDVVQHPKNTAVTRIHAVDTSASSSVPGKGAQAARHAHGSGERRSGQRLSAWARTFKLRVPGARR